MHSQLLNGNAIPEDATSSQSEYTFRRQLKTWLFNKSFLKTHLYNRHFNRIVDF